MLRLRWLWMAAMPLLVSCAGPGIANQAVYYRVPAAATVTLHQRLQVPAGTARVFLQDGAVVAKNRLHYYYPSCDFEVYQVSDGSARIEPATFAVSRLSVGDDLVVWRRSPLRYAALRFATNDDGMPPLVNRYVDYWLRSARQPQVMRLTCHGGFDFEGRATLPTAADIRKSLGAYASLGGGT